MVKIYCSTTDAFNDSTEIVVDEIDVQTIMDAYGNYLIYRDQSDSGICRRDNECFVWDENEKPLYKFRFRVGFYMYFVATTKFEEFEQEAE